MVVGLLVFDLPPDKQSPAQGLDYSLDFTLNPNAKSPVITVSGTKTLTQQSGQTNVFSGPVEFGAKAPLLLKNFSLETQLKPYPKLQHPFRAQALKECGQ